MAQPELAATWDAEGRAPRTRDEIALDLVVVATLFAVAIGLLMLVTGQLAWDHSALIAGVTGELPETLPAAILVLATTILNLAAGAAVARVAVGQPFDGLGRAVVAATVGAVLVDTAAMLLLGTFGLFRAPLLIVIQVALIALGSWARPLLRPGSLNLRAPQPGWVLVGVVFFAAVVLQLASPVVPFLDVLPNHVAPVERLRTFGAFTTLNETAAPLYGPSRSFLGYIALLGTVATISGVPGALAVSAFILPAALLVGVGVHRLATALAGPGAGMWGVILFALTASFARLTDTRATVLVLPLALGTLDWITERLERPNERERPVLRDTLLLGAGLGGAVLFHPVVGALTVLTAGFVMLLRPAFARVGVGGIAAGSVLALPQAATMLALGLPAVAGLLVIPFALAAAWIGSRPRVASVAVVIGRVVVFATVPILLIRADLILPQATSGITGFVGTMPLLVIGAVIGILVARPVARHPVVIAAFGAGIVAASLTQLVPQEAGPLAESLRFEVPKTLQYWLPVFTALVAAAGLFELWRRRSILLPLRAGLVGLFLVVAALPLRSSPIDDHHFGEHRLAETIAIDFRWAGRGYWANYPDTRHVVDAPRIELLDAVRTEIAAGRIGAETNLLHVAPTFEQWQATPFGVFTGVRETTVSKDGAGNIHTLGGRVRPLDRLDDLLHSGMFAYVVLEPGDGLPADARDRIVAAGYEPIFGNDEGELFTARPGAARR